MMTRRNDVHDLRTIRPVLLEPLGDLLRIECVVSRFLRLVLI